MLADSAVPLLKESTRISANMRGPVRYWGPIQCTLMLFRLRGFHFESQSPGAHCICIGIIMLSNNRFRAICASLYWPAKPANAPAHIYGRVFRNEAMASYKINCRNEFALLKYPSFCYEWFGRTGTVSDSKLRLIRTWYIDWRMRRPV